MLKAYSKIKLLSFLLAIFASGSIKSQVGFVDTAYYKAPSVENRATNGIVLPDSSIVITGQFVFCNERAISGVAKFNQKGDLDPTFNTGTGIVNPTTGAVSSPPNVVNYLPNGQFMIAGGFTIYNGVAINRVARLNANGSLDNTFVVGTGFDGSVFDSYLQPDGKMIYVGAFTKYNGADANRIARLNTDGTLDGTFLIGTGGAGGDIFAHDVQSDGKHLIAGNFTSFNGINFPFIARLNSDGTIDPSFLVGTVNPGALINDVLALPGGKIVVAGVFATWDTSAGGRIVRLYPNGKRDFTFLSGSGFNGNVNGLAIQRDGKILATGQFTSYQGVPAIRIVRIDTSGVIDAGFNGGGGFGLNCTNVFLDSAGGIFVTGTSIGVDSFTRIRLAKLLPNGKADHTFFGESKVNAQVMDQGLQSSGKAIIVGEFTKFNQISANRIARLNLDGTYDNSFTSGTGANGLIRTVAVLPDDKILIGGDFTQYNGTAINRIARLNVDGTLDATFAVGTGANSGGVYKIVKKGDGKIYIGGSFTQFNGAASTSRIARLNTNGSVDATFNTGTGFTANEVNDMAVQGDGKLIVVGGFVAYNSITGINRILRIDSVGTRDTSFNVGTGTDGPIYAVALQTDGKVVIGGGFGNFNAVAKGRIARLNANGSLDAAFNAVLTGNVAVTDVVMVGPTVLAGGTFTSVNGLAQNHFTFLTPTGAVDTSGYYQGRGIINLLVGTTTVNSFLVDEVNKKVYMNGTFVEVHAAPAIRFVRLLMSNIELLTTPAALCRGAVGNVYLAKRRNFNSGSSFIVQLSDSTGNFGNAINIGAGFNSSLGYDSIDFLIPVNTPYGSNYRIRIVSSDPVDTSNLSRPINILANVPATITASGPTAICGGDSITLTAAPVATGAIYSWSNGAVTPAITISTTGTYNVSVTAYNCEAVATPINVTASPAADSSISVLAASFCAGGSVNLTAAPGLSYNWSTNANTQSITVTQSGNYSLTVSSGAGCTSDSTVNINFNAINSYLISANGPTSFCTGGSVTLTAAPANSYHWSTNAITQSIIVNTAGTYSVTVTDANCSATSTPVTVVINQTPSATITPPGPITVCQGDSVTISAPAGLQYHWSNNVATQSQAVKTSGFYIVTVTDASTGCSAVSSPLSVQVAGSNAVTFNMPQDTVCNGGGIIQLTAGSPSGGTYTGNGITGSNFNPSTLGNTRVVITYTYTSGNCAGTASDSVFVNICTGIDDISGNSISVFPNPANSVLFVKTDGPALKDLEITDMLGQVVKKIPTELQHTTLAIDIAQLAPAAYILRVGDKKFRFIKAN